MLRTRRLPRFLTLIGASLALILAIAACGGDEEPTPTPIDVEAAVRAALEQALASQQEEEKSFFEGKTIRLLVGFSPGGGYDTYGRAIARHIGKHIPGNPTVVVENMTGAGSVVAANHIYNQARPDGLTLGLWNSNNLLIQALEGNPGILFSGERFGYLGAPSDGNPVCGVMGFTGLAPDEVIRPGNNIKFGATGAFGGSLSDVPRLMNEFLGTDFQIVSGYRGSSRARLAMEERETDAICLGWESMSVTARAMLDASGDDKLIPFVKVFPSTDPEIADLPMIGDLITDPEDKALWDVWALGYRFQRPWTTPPGTPEDRIEVLQQAFADTMADPEFLADAQEAGLYLNPVSGDAVEEYVLQILRISAETNEALQFLVQVE